MILPRWDRAQTSPLAFYDTEMTGLDPSKNEIIEIGIVRESPRGGDHVFDSVLGICRRAGLPEPKTVSSNGRTFSWTTKVKPKRPEDHHERAYLVNGYNGDEWSDAPDFAMVAPVLSIVLNDCIIIGSNPEIDIDFTRSEFDRLGAEPPRHVRRTIDIRTLAHEHLVPLGLKGTGLDAVCDFLGIHISPRHRALPDALRTREVYHTIFRAGPLDLLMLRLRRSRQESEP